MLTFWSCFASRAGDQRWGRQNGILREDGVIGSLFLAFAANNVWTSRSLGLRRWKARDECDQCREQGDGGMSAEHDEDISR